MKTAQLPPVRVAPSVREEIESALRDGESLSEFVEAAALQAARHRKARQAFLARGRASLAKAQQSGQLTPLADALDAMEARLQARLADEKKRLA
jgi:Arc/MetJ-type ribon-helix-helix transcriptional regulator